MGRPNREGQPRRPDHKAFGALCPQFWGLEPPVCVNRESRFTQTGGSSPQNWGYSRNTVITFYKRGLFNEYSSCLVSAWRPIEWLWLSMSTCIVNRLMIMIDLIVAPPIMYGISISRVLSRPLAVFFSLRAVNFRQRWAIYSSNSDRYD